jgi:hypothetical protein
MPSSCCEIFFLWAADPLDRAINAKLEQGPKYDWDLGFVS